MKVFTTQKQKLGEKGEDEAAFFLKKKGFSIIERNIANKFGEIDIVAKKRGIYFFCEVKAGKQGGWLNPAENLTVAKLRKFMISVGHYCYTHQEIKNYRIFAIIVLLPQKEGGEVMVDCIRL